MTFEIAIGIYMLWAFIGIIVYLVKFTDGECALEYYGFITRYVYKNSNMNIVGCVLVAIGYYIVYPFFIIRSLCMLIFWLMHIGRK